jgi:hypothetical protein
MIAAPTFKERSYAVRRNSLRRCFERCTQIATSYDMDLACDSLVQRSTKAPWLAKSRSNLSSAVRIHSANSLKVASAFEILIRSVNTRRCWVPQRMN